MSESQMTVGRPWWDACQVPDSIDEVYQVARHWRERGLVAEAAFLERAAARGYTEGRSEGYDEGHSEGYAEGEARGSEDWER